MDKYKTVQSYILINGNQPNISTVHSIKTDGSNKSSHWIYNVLCFIFFILILYFCYSIISKIHTPKHGCLNPYLHIHKEGLTVTPPSDMANKSSGPFNSSPSNLISSLVKTQINSIQAVQPLAGTITSGFGYRIHPTSKKLDFHPAIDIKAPEYSPIHSILGGQVTEVGTSKIFGKYIIVTHNNNMKSRYCHCNKIIVREGNFIKRGQIISKVGTTGLSTGPHLHLEVSINDVNIDPLLIIPQGYLGI